MMSTELDRCLPDEASGDSQNSVKVIVIGHPGSGKKTFVATLKKEWVEVLNRKPTKGENIDDLGIKGRQLAVNVIETFGKSRLAFFERLPSCDAFVLLYSLVSEDSFTCVCAVRDRIIQQKGHTIPIIFAANKSDIADDVDKVTRAYRDLNISCEWEHGHYEICARRSVDVKKVMRQMMKRVNLNDHDDGANEGANGRGDSRINRCKRFFSNMLK